MIKNFFIIILLMPFLFGVDDINEIKGQFHIISYEIDSSDDSKDLHATSLGGFLGYKKKTYKNSYIGIKFYSTNPVGSSKNSEKIEIFDEKGNGVDSLTESYLGFVDGHHTLMIGRHQLDTPLMNSDDTKIVPYSYNGVKYAWQFDDKSKINLGKIYHLKKPDDNQFSSQTAIGKMRDGISYIGVDEKKSSGLNYKIYYYNAKKLFDSAFFQIGKNAEFEKLKLFSTFQYIKTNKNSSGRDINQQKENGGEDVQINSIRLGIKYDKIGLMAAYSVNNGNDGLAIAYGGQADLFTNTMITSGINRGGPKIVSFRFKYDFSSKISSKLVYTDTKYRFSEHPDIPEIHTSDFKSIYLSTKYRYERDSYLQLRYEKISREVKDSDLDYTTVALVQAF